MDEPKETIAPGRLEEEQRSTSAGLWISLLIALGLLAVGCVLLVAVNRIGATVNRQPV